MKQLILTLFILTMTAITNLNAQLNLEKYHTIHHQLDDVMEMIDTTEVKNKLKEVEENYKENPSEINKVRVGIIYHEVTLNLSFLSKTGYKGYAAKSYEVLSELFNNTNTTPELLPFISSYRASALSLVVAETREMKLLRESFEQFENAVEKYGEISPLPEFLRGSVAENLPFFLFRKKKFAKRDFKSIIEKNENKEQYAGFKVMSFTYWAWANQHQGKKYREQAIYYLDKAIALDPNYEAGRKRAEELKIQLLK